LDKNRDVKEGDKYITQTEEKITTEGAEKSRFVKEGDFILSNSMSAGRPYILKITGCIHDGWLLLSQFSEILNTEYFYYLLSYYDGVKQQLSDNALGGTVKNLNIDRVKTIKIPLPPKDIQQKIVSECEAIDAEVQTAEQGVNNSRLEIENKIINLANQGYSEKKLSEITHINPSKTELKGVDENTNISFIKMASVSNDGFIQYKEDRLLKDLKKGSYTYFRENDIIIAKITPCMENGKCALATGLTNHLAMGSSEFHVIRCDEKIISAKYIFSLLNRVKIRQEAERNMTGSSGHRRVPASFYQDYKIPVPDLKIQQNLVEQIEQLENKIATAQKIINEAASKKQAVLKHYL
jgi:restriction endonuclease S subunit